VSGLPGGGSLAAVWRRVTVDDRFLPCAIMGLESGGVGRVLRLCGTGGGGKVVGGVSCSGCSTTSLTADAVDKRLLLLGDSLGGDMLTGSVSPVACLLDGGRRGGLSGR
jgi:hypothetical protein